MLHNKKSNLNYFVSVARAFNWEFPGWTDEPSTDYYLEKSVPVPGALEPYPLTFISRAETYAEKLVELKDCINSFTGKSVDPSYLERNLDNSAESASRVVEAVVTELKRLYAALAF